jgi:hypothetical protein
VWGMRLAVRKFRGRWDCLSADGHEGLVLRGGGVSAVICGGGVHGVWRLHGERMAMLHLDDVSRIEM